MRKRLLSLFAVVVVCSVLGLVYHFSFESHIHRRYPLHVDKRDTQDAGNLTLQLNETTLNAGNVTLQLNETTLSTLKVCEDKIQNCSDFGYESCEDFKEWAGEYCSEYCGICNGQGIPTTTPLVTIPPRIDENCSDLIPNCIYYGSCTGPYEAWARVRCQKYCRFCVLPGPEVCEDEKPNCAQLDSDLCWSDRLRPYREEHCKRFCGLCPGQTPKKKPRECKDYVDSCAQFGPHVCTKHPAWAKHWCADYCGLCATTTLSTTSMPCVDRLSTCQSYTDKKTMCCGQYYSWAKWNCPVWCGFCTPAVTTPRLCSDKNPLCASMNADICTNIKFYNYVREFCAGFCKICDQPFEPTCGTTTVQMSTVTSTAETTKEVLNGTTDAWTGHTDAYNGTTENTNVYNGTTEVYTGNTGTYNGTNEVPTGITKVPTGNTKVPNGTTYTQATTTAPTECVQGGLRYQEGQSWDTAECDQFCECIDAASNKIDCQPLKCPQDQENCVLIRIPGQCCPRLECAFHNPVHPQGNLP